MLKLKHPVSPVFINQPFGNVLPEYTAMGLKGHNGIDFRAFHGEPVYAAHDGICYPEIDDKGGNGVVIRALEDCDLNGQQVRIKTIYWHLVQDDAVVKTGQQIKAGDLIGYADNTGMSTGDHLHFGCKPQAWNEVNWSWSNVAQDNGYFGAIDPQPFFDDSVETPPEPFQRDLKFGLMSDPDVMKLQKILGVTPVLGNFLWLTLSAVKKYQKDHNIPQTGYVGPLTRTTLNRETTTHPS